MAKSTHAALLIGAGLLQVPLIQEAQALGLYTIATDGDAQAPGAMVSDEFRLVDTYDISGHQTLARELSQARDVHILGCCTAGADVAPTVASAAQVLGVSGIPLEIARRTHDKGCVRLALYHAGMQRYQPNWTLYDLHTISTLASCIDLEISQNVNYPVVVKPLSQRASRGITLVATRDALPAALEKAAAYGPKILVEECLEGTEHSVEAIFDGDGGLWWFNIVDRPFTYDGGCPIELGHVNPSCLSDEYQGAIKTMLLEAALALGVTWGPFKVDAMWTASGPKILECTARLSGGWDSQGTSPLTGRHPLRTLLQLACGLPVQTFSLAENYAACAAILPSCTGVVRTLPTLLPTMCSLLLPPASGPQTITLQWVIKPGDTLVSGEHNGQRPGYVLATGSTYEEAWRRARTAADTLAAAVEV